MLQTGIGFIRFSVGHKTLFIVLCLYAPQFHEQRSDLPRKAGCTGRTQNSCSLKRCISRLHVSLYKNAIMVFTTHFSETSSENLLEVYSLLITWRNFWAYTFSNSSYTGRLRIDCDVDTHYCCHLLQKLSPASHNDYF